MTGGNPRIACCPVDGCTLKVSRSKLFCTIHWHRLPGHFRKALYGRCHSKPSEKIQRLIARAVAALATVPGSRPKPSPQPVPDAPAVRAASASARNRPVGEVAPGATTTGTGA